MCYYFIFLLLFVEGKIKQMVLILEMELKTVGLIKTQ